MGAEQKAPFKAAPPSRRARRVYTAIAGATQRARPRLRVTAAAAGAPQRVGGATVAQQASGRALVCPVSEMMAGGLGRRLPQILFWGMIDSVGEGRRAASASAEPVGK